MIQERANGLYGPTAFLIANFIIGLPFLCSTHSSRTDFGSRDNIAICNCDIFPRESSPRDRAILQLPHDLIPRPYCSRISRRPYISYIPNLRGRSCPYSVRERSMDVCRWISRLTYRSQRLLEKHFLSD